MKLNLSEKERAYFRKQGSKGGKLGGRAAAANMTAEQRKARAKKAAEARWSKKH